MTGDYFSAAKPKPKANLQEIPTGPVVVDRDREAEALKRGEGVGFVSREAIVPEVASLSTGRQRRKIAPPKKIMVTGPGPKIDRFIAFCDANEFPSYLAAIDHLLDALENRR